MADYDALIDYRRFYSARLGKFQGNGTNVKAHCPFHEDKNPSLSLDLQTGLWKCHGCGEEGNANSFLVKTGEAESGTEADSILRQEAGVGAGAKSPTQSGRKAYTIDDYAKDKRLPVDFLQELGIKNGKTGIQIPYMDESGKVVSTRQRYGDTGHGPRFTWSRGSKVHLYGLWKLPQIREQGYCIIVEGESDCHTLWWHQYPALGVPGASIFQPEWANLIEGLTVYIYQEPDTAGETFIRKVAEALASAGRQGDVYRLQLISHKDPSDLHTSDPESFQEHWAEMMQQADPVDVMEAAGSVEHTIPDAPVQLRQPPNWRFNADGVFTINEKSGLPVCVSRVPIILRRRLKSLEDGEEKVEVCWRRDGKWHSEVVKRSVLFHSQGIIALADRGLTVTSENARKLVQFLGALESENIDLLERGRSVQQLGWHGKQFVPGVNEDLVIDVDPQTSSWLESYTATGSSDKWREMVASCRDNNLFRFLIACSFAAPLLRLTDHRIFLVHNWGDTRIGKTAAMKAALSVWGDPEGLITSFYATKVGLERLAGFFRDLPLGVDERQVSNQLGDNLMYMLTLGSSKVRGAKQGGLQSGQSWRTIILTTGEEPLTTSSSFAGLHSRVLELHGAPFRNERQAQQFHDMSDFGHWGPEFIRRVVGRIEEVRSLHKKLNENLTMLYPDKVGSHLSAIALVTAAERFVAEWIFEAAPEEAEDEALKLAQDIARETASEYDTDLAHRAGYHMADWVRANESQFNEGTYRGELYGLMDNDPELGHCYLVFPHVFDRVLEQAGFSPRAARQALKDKGMIVPDKRNKTTILKRFGVDGKPARFVRFVPNKLFEEDDDGIAEVDFDAEDLPF